MQKYPIAKQINFKIDYHMNALGPNFVSKKIND